MLSQASAIATAPSARVAPGARPSVAAATPLAGSAVQRRGFRGNKCRRARIGGRHLHRWSLPRFPRKQAASSTDRRAHIHRWHASAVSASRGVRGKRCPAVGSSTWEVWGEELRASAESRGVSLSSKRIPRRGDRLPHELGLVGEEPQLDLHRAVLERPPAHVAALLVGRAPADHAPEAGADALELRARGPTRLGEEQVFVLGGRHPRHGADLRVRQLGSLEGRVDLRQTPRARGRCAPSPAPLPTRCRCARRATGRSSCCPALPSHARGRRRG
jgi:hypothetical protein